MIHEFLATHPYWSALIIWIVGVMALITVAAFIWLLMQPDKPESDYRRDANDWMNN